MLKKILSVQKTTVTLEYNKNIASKPKSDIAFRVHHIAWMSQIRQQNIKTDPFNDNSQTMHMNNMLWQAKKIAYQRSKYLLKLTADLEEAGLPGLFPNRKGGSNGVGR